MLPIDFCVYGVTMVSEEELNRYSNLFGFLNNAVDVKSLYQIKQKKETWFDFLKRKYDGGYGIEVVGNYDDIAPRYKDFPKMTFFCGSSFGKNPLYKEIAWQLGKFCADNGIVVMCGGGRFGMMGTVIRSTLEHNGKVIAISAESVWKEESDARFANENTGPVFDYTDEKYKGRVVLVMAPELDIRQNWLVKGADAYGVLPGGKGTAYELHQILVQKSLREHTKPITIFNPMVNIDGKKKPYWTCFMQLMKQYESEGFAKSDCLNLLEEVGGEGIPLPRNIYRALDKQIGAVQISEQPAWERVLDGYKAGENILIQKRLSFLDKYREL